MPPASPFAAYLRQIDSALRAGNATEHTHRPALKELIESLGNGIVATNEPQRIECGSPDYIVTRGSSPLGYVEAKDVGADLVRIEEGEQLGRYRASLRNLILTDYLEFRLYRNGEPVLAARLARQQRNGVLKSDPEGAHQAERLFQWFLQADVPSIASPRELAERMARVAQLLRELIRQVFAHEGRRGDLHGQYEAFRKVLLADLSVEQFADMYAQTIAYGLFAARCNHSGAGFTREHAGRELPRTNPFLRKLFNTIAGADLDERVAWAVDDLADLLARADMAAILADFGRATRQEDPVVHFYETFLAAYDPKLRETRGVYYTPEPVVGYIVRSVDAILKGDFGIEDGLADKRKVRLTLPTPHGERASKTVETHRVQILDPAVGTGTFLHAVVARIRERFAGAAGLWPAYVAEHLLPRLYGFELLMAPYAVAHMKLGLQLRDSGYDFAADERLRVFLTNSLEEAHEAAGLPLFAQWLADEAAAAAQVKREAPIMVVLGNPPYSGHSANKGGWIEHLMDAYKQSAELKKPAQAKWLSDDYVKFIRFAQWRIEQTGYGVLAFVTNHGWLDNPTFLDMRASLMASFDALYLLDLHGNSKKKEAAPDGGKDENVFDIQQGVAICLLVKRKPGGAGATAVHHADLWGPRAAKYEWLAAHDATSTRWRRFAPTAPRRLFVPQDEDLLAEYERGWPLPAAMDRNGAAVPGFATQHDDFAISYSRSEAIEKIARFISTADETKARELFDLCAQKQWSYTRAKAQLTIADAEQKLIDVDYRPFDRRVTVYDRNVLTHRRERISVHLLHDNFALVIPKNAEAIGADQSEFFFCVARPTDLNFYRRGGAYLLPLYVYPGESGRTALWENSAKQRTANFSPTFLADLKSKIGPLPITPEDVFAYIYALLFSPGYRRRYGAFLKRDFPRVPLTGDPALFRELARLGHRLIDLHLLRANGPHEPGYPVAGNNRVDRTEYKDGRVYLNAEQYFDGVPSAVWDFHVGGYQVAHKWLKDRKGRLLTFDELQHYRRVVAALDETLAVQAQIDAAVPGWPLA
ncbi:MAG: type ISP restriction/modification enzyme [Betaproteobacteria bacterium]